jgi:hypothetical protein
VRRSASPAVTESNSHFALVVRAPTRPSFGFGTSKLLVRWKIFAAPMPLVPSGYLTHNIAAFFQSRLARWRTRCTPLPTKAGGHVQACQTLNSRASQRLFDDQKRRSSGAPRFPDGYMGVRKFSIAMQRHVRRKRADGESQTKLVRYAKQSISRRIWKSMCKMRWDEID